MRDDELRALERASLESPGDRVAQARWASALKRQGEFLPALYSPMTFAVWSWLPSRRVPGRGYMALLVYERRVIGGRDEIVTEPMVGEPGDESEIHRWLGIFPETRMWVERPSHAFPDRLILHPVSLLDQVDGALDFVTLRAQLENAGRMAGQHWERLVAQVLEGNGNPLAYDGVPMFSQAHPPASNDFTRFASREGDSVERILGRIEAEREVARRLGIPPVPRRSP